MSTTNITQDPYYAHITNVDFNPVDEVIDAFEGLTAFYDGKEVEGNVCKFNHYKEPVMKEIIFSMDGKKYRFFVEEIE